jgi:hypothetical protein
MLHDGNMLCICWGVIFGAVTLIAHLSDEPYLNQLGHRWLRWKLSY